MIRFACPGCSASFNVPDEKAGKSGKCPKCQTQFVIPGTAASPPAPAPADDQPVEIQPCPKCGTRLSVMAGDLGLDIECTNCQTVFKAVKAGSAPKPQSKPPRPAAVDDDEDDRPKSKSKSSRRDDDDEDDDRPKKKSRRDDDEDDQPKSKRGSRRGDDDEDDRPKSKGKSSRRDEDDEDDRPKGKSKSSRRDDDEDEDDRPSKRGSRRGDDDDDDDDRPSKRKGKVKKRKGGDVGESKRMTAALLALFVGWLGIHKFYMGYTTAGVLMIFGNCIAVSGIIALIEAIIYFTKTDEDFIETYQRNEKQWF